MITPTLSHWSVLGGDGFFQLTENETYEGPIVRGDCLYLRARSLIDVKGQMDGRGVLNWSDGSRYEGEFKDSKRHGSGVMIWADGRRSDRVISHKLLKEDRYNGDWMDNKRSGKGLMTWPLEQVYMCGPSDLGQGDRFLYFSSLS